MVEPSGLMVLEEKVKEISDHGDRRLSALPGLPPDFFVAINTRRFVNVKFSHGFGMRMVLLIIALPLIA
jgi:hypothetical protein